MDASDEQRLLQILRVAHGDAAALSLVPLDITFGGLPQTERARLREAFLAAAVPHWFDAPFIAALLATTADEASVLVAQLQRLTNVEPFPARGEGACNVHEASRLALREHLRIQQPELWKTYARRAHAHLAAGKETHERIEALFHLFAADADAAVAVCETLDRDLRLNPTTKSAMCLALSELTTAGWLNGASLAEALRPPLWHRISRGEASQLEAEAMFLLDLTLKHAHPWGIAGAHRLLGDVRLSHGEITPAHTSYSESLRICRGLSASDPANADWQRDLSVSLIKLGDIAVAQGDVAAALRYFTESKTIRESLAAIHPANAESQRDLSVSLIKVGEIAVAQGDLAAALHYFSDDLAIAERLAASDPANAAWQRDLSVSLNQLGDVAVAQGDLAAALRYFTQSKTIRESLTASDPANPAWQRDLSVSLNKLGDVAEAQGDLAAALQYFTESKTIRQPLAASDPANADWQRDLSVSLNKLGDIAVAQGDLAAALGYFTGSKTIREHLAASDPANAAWQRDLAVSHFKLHEFAQKSGDKSMMEAELRATFIVLERMKSRGMHMDAPIAQLHAELLPSFTQP